MIPPPSQCGHVDGERGAHAERAPEPDQSDLAEHHDAAEDGEAHPGAADETRHEKRAEAVREVDQDPADEHDARREEQRALAPDQLGHVAAQQKARHVGDEGYAH